VKSRVKTICKSGAVKIGPGVSSSEAGGEQAGDIP